ncbi:dynamin family protein [Micromonospora sp. NPDC048898]|uniref:dynamin family protein n=1 Tax=Micromonospora sp. NPDC048898 TaxID=3364260 RepID=UPI003723239D
MTPANPDMADPAFRIATLRDDPALDRLHYLCAEVVGLAREANLGTSEHPVLADPGWVSRLRERASAAVTVIVIGQVSSGKSTFVNSLLGRKLLPSSDRPTDGVVSVLQACHPGMPEQAVRVDADGRETLFSSVADGARFLARQHSDQADQMSCREVRFHLDEPLLHNLRIVNTPGLGDRIAAFQDITLDYLRDDAADLVIWTFFPDAAANRAEIETFADALARRRGTVLGIVTRALEDHEDDDDYDPHTDPAFADVVGQLRAHLGDYLGDILLYDAYHAHALVRRLRGADSQHLDPSIARELARCGYDQVREALRAVANDASTRTHALMTRCAATAAALRHAALAAEQVFAGRAALHQHQMNTLHRIERDVIGPARDQLDTEIHAIADRFASELVDILAAVAVEVVMAQFTLTGSLRSAASSSLTRGANDSIGVRLDRSIDEATTRKLAELRFHERLSDVAASTIRWRMQALAADLAVTLPKTDRAAGSVVAPVDVQRVAGPAGDIAGDLFNQVLSQVAAAAMKAAGSGTVSVVGRAGAGRAGTALAATVAQNVARSAATGTVARSATVFTAVMVPLEIRKLYKDFNAGKGHLMQALVAGFHRSRGAQATRIRDTLVPVVDDAFDQLRTAARAALLPPDDGRQRWALNAAAAANAAEALETLARTFERHRHDAP